MNCELGAGLQLAMQFETKEVLRNRFSDTALFETCKLQRILLNSVDFEMRLKEQFSNL